MSIHHPLSGLLPASSWHYHHRLPTITGDKRTCLFPWLMLAYSDNVVFGFPPRFFLLGYFNFSIFFSIIFKFELFRYILFALKAVINGQINLSNPPMRFFSSLFFHPQCVFSSLMGMAAFSGASMPSIRCLSVCHALTPMLIP